MTELEDDSCRAQIVKRRRRIDFWIYDRGTFRQGGFWFMVINHDHVHAAMAKIDNLRGRRGSAVERDQELRMILGDATLNALPAQAVAFFHSQWQKQIRHRAITAQGFRK